MFFSKKDWLKTTRDQDFGEYLEFIESNVFEIEVAQYKYQKAINKIKKQIRRAHLRVFLYAFSLLGCPLLLSYLAISNDALTISLYVQLISYLLWFVMGVYLIKKSIFTVVNKNLQCIADQENLKYALISVVEYGKSSVDAFFEKKDEISSDYFKQLDSKELSFAKKGLNLLEFDLSVFHDIARKSNKCNVKPLILNEDFYVEKREFSKDYLTSFYNFKLNDIKQ